MQQLQIEKHNNRCNLKEEKTKIKKSNPMNKALELRKQGLHFSLSINIFIWEEIDIYFCMLPTLFFFTVDKHPISIFLVNTHRTSII